MEIMGIQIRTIISDNIARRCDGCREVIEGTPWRVNILDIVAAETPVSWAERPVINPGPFQFHGDPRPACAAWMAEKGYLFCRTGEVREIMRPIAAAARPRRRRTSRAGACATGSTATTTSSSPPEPRSAPRAATPPRG